jgi:hypothetical protein
MASPFRVTAAFSRVSDRHSASFSGKILARQGAAKPIMDGFPARAAVQALIDHAAVSILRRSVDSIVHTEPYITTPNHPAMTRPTTNNESDKAYL